MSATLGEPHASPGAGHDRRSTAELLAGYAATLTELRRRKVIRSNNAPAGDYGEWLVARALGAPLLDNLAAKSFDLRHPDGRRVQVKTRVISIPVQRSQLQASVFRSFDFELAALVQLRDLDYSVHKAVLLPVTLVQELSAWVAHVNGWRLLMTPAVMSHPEAVDVTLLLQAAAIDA